MAGTVMSEEEQTAWTHAQGSPTSTHKSRGSRISLLGGPVPQLLVSQEGTRPPRGLPRICLQNKVWTAPLGICDPTRPGVSLLLQPWVPSCPTWPRAAWLPVTASVPSGHTSLCLFYFMFLLLVPMSFLLSFIYVSGLLQLQTPSLASHPCTRMNIPYPSASPVVPRALSPCQVMSVCGN